MHVLKSQHGSGRRSRFVENRLGEKAIVNQEMGYVTLRLPLLRRLVLRLLGRLLLELGARVQNRCAQRLLGGFVLEIIDKLGPGVGILQRLHALMVVTLDERLLW